MSNITSQCSRWHQWSRPGSEDVFHDDSCSQPINTPRDQITLVTKDVSLIKCILNSKPPRSKASPGSKASQKIRQANCHVTTMTTTTSSRSPKRANLEPNWVRTITCSIALVTKKHRIYPQPRHSEYNKQEVNNDSSIIWNSTNRCYTLSIACCCLCSEASRALIAVSFVKRETITRLSDQTLQTRTRVGIKFRFLKTVVTRWGTEWRILWAGGRRTSEQVSEWVLHHSCSRRFL